jgi:hypothetical protein
MGKEWRSKIRWFRSSTIFDAKEHDWTFTYVNSLGETIRCIIDGRGNGQRPITVLNENGCQVYLEMKDLRTIIQVLPS